MTEGTVAMVQGLAALAVLAAFLFGVAAATFLREGRDRRRLSYRARRIARQRLPSADSRRLPAGLALAVRLGAAQKGGSAGPGRGLSRRLDGHLLRFAERAGFGDELSGVGLRRASERLALAGAAAGAAVGAALSAELTMLLGIAGCVAGGGLCARELKGIERQRKRGLVRELPEMLDVMALGLRSGMAFDQAMGLYARHFDTALAADCERAMELWSSGLASREEALQRLSQGYDSPQLDRIVRGMARCLRLGTPLAGMLDEAAAEARAQHKAQLQERVAKAPVKMMVPTAAFMLPALLLLVLGPVLLQLAE